VKGGYNATMTPFQIILVAALVAAAVAVIVVLALA
jgi:hypothetical protein